jgi:hypothetical protein
MITIVDFPPAPHPKAIQHPRRRLVTTRLSESRMAWLAIGTVFGMILSYYCPHEPAYANAAAMSEKFAMCTTETQIGNSEAIFVLDMVTGRLLGAAHATNPQTPNVFTQTYQRNLAQDFGVVDNAQYVMVPGRALIQARAGGASPATGVVYVGELTSGVINMYGFGYVQANRPVPTQQLTLLGSFPWRQRAG